MKYQLYYQNAEGLIYQWSTWAEAGYLYTSWGRVDPAGEIKYLQQQSKKICEAKNPGKANATTIEVQAEKEALALFNIKKKLKYRETIEAAKADTLLFPMLAETFQSRINKKKNGITFPADAQPKLDGVRALAYLEDGVVKLLSRGGKQYTCAHIQEALAKILIKGLILDGEIYTHGISLQDINSLIKRPQDNSLKLQYHIYDIADASKSWPERRDQLKSLVLKAPLIPVLTIQVADIEELTTFETECIASGYEGCMLRLYNNSNYCFAERSTSLLKCKRFEDAEYEVVGWRQGIGKFSEVPVWLCQLPNSDIVFEVTSMGTMEYRKELFKTADTYIGKKLTVKFWGKTEDQIPKFAQGRAFRLEEDL